MLISDLPKLEPNEPEVPNQPVDEYVSLKQDSSFTWSTHSVGSPIKSLKPTLFLGLQIQVGW